MVEARVDVDRVAPDVFGLLGAVDTYVRASGLDPSLLDLVKIRASQINGCAYCIDMHTRAARGRGESERRLYGLPAWRESPFYSARERAALGWTEAVTLVSQSHVSDEAYEEARRHFSDRELVDLTVAVIAINGWNRLLIGTRTMPEI